MVESIPKPEVSSDHVPTSWYHCIRITSSNFINSHKRHADMNMVDLIVE